MVPRPREPEIEAADPPMDELQVFVEVFAVMVVGTAARRGSCPTSRE